MIDEVVLLRHGRTPFNLQRRMQGQIDVPLDIVGQWQVDQSAFELAQQYYWAKVSNIARNPSLLPQPGEGAAVQSNIDEYCDAPAAERKLSVVSSDLFRAQQTAHAFADILGLPVKLDPRLRERSFGQWEGLNREEIQRMDPKAYAAWKATLGVEPVYGVESREHLGRRAAEAIEDLVLRAKSDMRSETLMVVGHGAWIHAAIATLLNLDAENVSTLAPIRNAFWSRISVQPTGEHLRWTLEEYNRGPVVARIVDWENGPTNLHSQHMPMWIEL